MSLSFARLVRPLMTVVAFALIASVAAPAVAQETRPAAPPTAPAPTAAPKAPPATAPTTPATTPPATKPNGTTKPTPPAAPAGEAAKGTATASEDFVLFKTSMGDILIELNREKAPISVANFIKYVESGFYDGTIFHRVIKDFVIQGGGFNGELVQKKTEPPIKNEWENGLKNLRGTLSMARTSAPDSATSQFFINVADNAPLDQPRGGAAYAVFGRVVKGMEVVDKIREVPTTSKTLTTTGGPGKMSDVPAENVTVTKATKVSAADAKKMIGGG